MSTSRGVRIFLAVATLCWSLATVAQPVPIPPLASRVTDRTATLTREQTAALEQKLQAFEAAKGSQLAVLIIPTTGDEQIEQYSLRVVEQWKLGRKNVDDGALLIVAKMTERCASRSVMAWRVCSTTPTASASSVKSSCHAFNRGTSMAASRLGSTA